MVMVNTEPELRFWDDLTEEEQLNFARKVVASGIIGWDNLAQMAYECGIEPDGDTIPTLYELKVMAQKGV